MADCVKQEVLAVARAVMDRYNEADFNGMMEYFTDDTVWFPPNSDPTVGKKECILVSCGFHSSGNQGARITECGLMFEQLGDDFADVIDFVDVLNTAGEVASHIKHWILFKKVKGKWLVHRFAYSPRTKPAVTKSDE